MADPKIPQETASTVDAPDAKRRRFLRAGAAVTPAVLTLASQPALGTTCFTPSRSLSKNTSVSQQGKYGECFGAQSPGNYKQQVVSGGPGNAYSWPISPDTPFHSRFPGRRFIVSSGGMSGERSLTFIEVLSLPGNDDRDKGQVVFHIIGAYLNKLRADAGSGGVQIPDVVLTLGDIVNIYSEWDQKNYFEPMASVQWNGEQIKNYLITNGIVR